MGAELHTRAVARHPHNDLAMPDALARGYEAWEKLAEVKISANPGEYSFRQCYVATDADEKVLKQVMETVGDGPLRSLPRDHADDARARTSAASQ